MAPPMPAEVAAVFNSFPPKIRKRLMTIRRLVFDVAAAAEGVGVITETLKWNEPAYLTQQTKSGTTIRFGWKAASPCKYRILVNCQTDLIASFRERFGDELAFEGDRAIVMEEGEVVPSEVLAVCIEAALTYHLRRSSGALSPVSKPRGRSSAPSS